MSDSQKAQAKAKIKELIDKYHSYKNDDEIILDGITESSVVTQFIEPLLGALGWPIEDNKRFKKELKTVAGKPDITLIPEQIEPLYVEAKRFGRIKRLQSLRDTGQRMTGLITPVQMALPGMANDRTLEEQQAINYAFKNGSTWAILTNFEHLRLFNARRDWLVLSFENPSAYLQEFDTLWQLSYDNILSGGLDRLSDQRYREDVDTEYLNLINTYREKLAQDIVAHTGANRWAFIGESGRVSIPMLREVVQLFLDRMVVIRFAEDHHIIPAETLRKQVERSRPDEFGLSYSHNANEIVYRLFRSFDQHHNSTLFAPHPVLDGQAEFSESLIRELVDSLYEARYRSLTPDIMGNTYEQYLGETLVQINGSVETRSNLETRKKQGSYYTPQVIVRYLVDNALGRILYGTENGKPDGKPIPGESRKRYDEIGDLRIIDPACGSGSFLIYAYQVFSEFYHSEIKRIEDEAKVFSDEQAAEGLSMIEIVGAVKSYTKAHMEVLKDFPRIILEKHIYGVDLDPQAAELASVNLLFRAIEDNRRLWGSISKKLPLILNQNIKCGNGLIGVLGDLPDGVDAETLAPMLAELRKLRAELVADSHNEAVRERIAEVETEADTLLNGYLATHFTEPSARRPMNWMVAFPECFVDEKGVSLVDGAGFHVVVGNPPWEIVKPDLREYYAQFDPEIESRLTRKRAESRIRELNKEDKSLEPGWDAQKARIIEDAAYYKKDDAGFTRQGRGDTATHKLFMERAYSLLNDKGRLGYVVPSGIYTDLGTKQLREMLLNEGHIQYLFSFSNERNFFKDVHHAFHFCLIGAQHGIKADGFKATFRFNPRVAVAPDDLEDFIADENNLIYMRSESIKQFSPDSLSVMEFKSQTDADVTELIYANAPLLGDKVDGAWNIKLNREFDMTLDRALFNQQEDGYPLYEGKMIHQYDPHYATQKYWVSHRNAEQYFRKKKSETATLDYHIPRIGFREITSPTNTRTLIATILPTGVCCNHKISVVSPRLSAYKFNEMLYCLAILNSFSLDYIARLKITGGMSMFHFYQLPMPRLNPGDPAFDAIVPRAARLTCTTPEFASLWKEVMGRKWKKSDGVTDSGERQVLRDEIDALVAHLYGLSRDDFEHILGTFPLVFVDDESGRKKRETLLEVYDRMKS